MNIHKTCGDSSMQEQLLFQAVDGGSIPTSPLQKNTPKYKTRGDSLRAEQLSLQMVDGGASPTSPLQMLPIKYKDAYELVCKFHYLGTKRFIGQYCFGIVQNYEFVGAVVYSPLSVPNSATSFFGLPRGNYPQFLEMSRLVLHPSLNQSNAASRLIGYSLRELKKIGIRAVISYADSARHIGTVYQASNFRYYGLSPQRNDFIFADGRKLTRGKSKGFEGKWIPRSRKHRYVYLFDKSLELVLEEQPYPRKPQTQEQGGAA